MFLSFIILLSTPLMNLGLELSPYSLAISTASLMATTGGTSLEYNNS
ncbi:hypothetical protein KA119_00685 [Candidatus Gracilibacteria bacterium]|nr:hypothetical protein [Candidatus Gracilibacteria bacterium]